MPEPLTESEADDGTEFAGPQSKDLVRVQGGCYDGLSGDALDLTARIAPLPHKKDTSVMLPTQAVGIDLGTTYSSIAHLNQHGEPVTIANGEGEFSTPSVVLFDGDNVIVGTEALRNSILHPKRVIQNSKRFMGETSKRWDIGGRKFTPTDVAFFILNKLIGDAKQHIGVIERAVITVPAQFGDAQRRATIEAGHRAGLKRVDVINEPVAAALCYVLGTEGLWFTELVDEQKILVYDLGGGTFDLSLVSYSKNEVNVMLSGGDLKLGGIDWNRKLEAAVAQQFFKEFKEDPLKDPASRQFLALEVEQAKRSLSARPRAALTCQHAGHRKTFQIQQAQFEKVTKPLVVRTLDITQRMLKENNLGWAHVDAVLTVGGASRMPMVRNALKALSGRTLNTTLSPDQSIAHGATYYAGMLLSNDKFAQSILDGDVSRKLSEVRQQSVTARGLGVLVRDTHDQRIPRYLIRPNTPLPAAATETYGTVIEDQRTVRLHVLESGPTSDDPPVVLGECVIDDLPRNLPVDSQVAVTISYDASARVHVTAREVKSGREASTEIIRQENVVPQLEMRPPPAPFLRDRSDKPSPKPRAAAPQTGGPEAAPVPRAPARANKKAATSKANPVADESDRPQPLCNQCGAPLMTEGNCKQCGAPRPIVTRQPKSAPRQQATASQKPATAKAVKPAALKKKAKPPSPGVKEPKKHSAGLTGDAAAKRPSKKKKKPSRQKPPQPAEPPAGDRSDHDLGEEEFWKVVE